MTTLEKIKAISNSYAGTKQSEIEVDPVPVADYDKYANRKMIFDYRRVDLQFDFRSKYFYLIILNVIHS